MKFRDMPKLPLLFIVAMLAVGLWAYPSLPAQIPTHWGPSGEIDAWSAKSVWSVFMMPLMMSGLYVLFWVMPYLDPKRGNLMASKQVYSLILELVTGLFSVLYVATLAAAFNEQLPVDRIITVAVGVMFIVLGNYMGRVKRNWTMGVRYSWTLSDDTVWLKTNRLGGRLFMLAGVMGIVGSVLPDPWNIVMLIGPALLMIPITYVYSWRLYRKLHPEEMEPAERV
jgi:uncharacterized membrane protein